MFGEQELLGWLKKDKDVLMTAKGGFFSALVLAVAIGAAVSFWLSEYHYSGRIASLTETLQTKEFPKAPPAEIRWRTPAVITKTIPDPAQVAQIVELTAQVRALKKLKGASATPKLANDAPCPSGSAGIFDGVVMNAHSGTAIQTNGYKEGPCIKNSHIESGKTGVEVNRAPLKDPQ